MINIFKTFIDFLLPKRCLLCGKIINSENSLCPECFNDIHFITEPYCQHCGKPLNLNYANHNDLYCADCLKNKDIFRFRRSAILYDEISKKLILDFKFSHHIENKKLLTNWLFFAGKDIFSAGVDLIIPVPLHYTRLLRRRYNQSAMLAMELSKLTNIPAKFDILKKIKRTKPQALCNEKERRQNIKNAFKITNPQKIKGKRIVLIDDVYTTGSTIKECTKTLLKAGAASVDSLTISMVYFQ